MRPPSFNEDYMTEWSEWALDHGLPDLPETVKVGESVPVARWAGPSFGAVLHVQWSWSDDHEDDRIVSEVQVFDRVPGGWRAYGGQGGTDWTITPLRRPRLPPMAAGIGGTFRTHEDGRSCCTVEGMAGEAATTIEVSDSTGVTRQPLESPLGVFIVAIDGDVDATLRVLDETGAVLAEETISPRALTDPVVPVSDPWQHAGMADEDSYRLARIELVVALIRAIDNMDQVNAAVRASANAKAAKEALMASPLSFTEMQAVFVLDMQVRRQTQAARQDLLAELQRLRSPDL